MYREVAASGAPPTERHGNERKHEQERVNGSKLATIEEMQPAQCAGFRCGAIERYQSARKGPTDAT
jgi:hypothetical protein